MPLKSTPSFLETLFDATGYNKLFLREGKRPRIRTPDSILQSPCDSKLIRIQTLHHESSIDGKQYGLFNTHYSFQEIVHHPGQQQLFEGGTAFYFYLSPTNLHYCLFPCDCTITDRQYHPHFCKPILITQNAWVDNERLVLYADTKFGFPMILVMIGSFLVSGIECVARVEQSYRKGELLGGFKQGSMVVMLFPKDKVKPLGEIPSRLLIGEPFASLPN